LPWYKSLPQQQLQVFTTKDSERKEDGGGREVHQYDWTGDLKRNIIEGRL